MTFNTDQAVNNRLGAGQAALGSTSGVDASDPIWLRHDGKHYLYSPGTAGNHVSFANPTAGATGDLDVRLRMQRLPGGVGQYMFGNARLGGNGRWGTFQAGSTFSIVSWNNAGTLQSVAISAASITNVSYNEFFAGWFRIRRVQSTGIWTLWVEPDQEVEPTWTTPVDFPSAMTTDVYSSIHPYAVFDGGAPSAGFCRYIRLITPSGEVIVNPAVDIDASVDRDAGQNGWITKTGHAVTVSRSNSGPKTVVVTNEVIAPDGSNDWLQMGVSGYIGSLQSDETVLMAVRIHDGTTTPQCLFATRPTITGGTPNLGVSLRINVSPGSNWNAQAIIGDGTTGLNVTATPTQPFGREFVVGWRFDQVLRQMRMFTSDGVTLIEATGSSIASLGSCASGEAPRIGATSTGLSPTNSEITTPFLHAPVRISDVDLLNISAKLLSGAPLTPSALPQGASLYTAKGLTLASQTVPNLRNFTEQAFVGSSTAIDANDPVIAAHDGTHLVWFPGTDANQVSRTLATVPELRGTVGIKIRAAFRYLVNPTPGYGGIGGSCAGSVSGLFSAAVHSSGRLGYAMSDGTFGQTVLGNPGDLVAGTWYAVEWEADYAANTVGAKYKALSTAEMARSSAALGPDATWTTTAPVAGVRPAFNSAVAHTDAVRIGTRSGTLDDHYGPIAYCEWLTDGVSSWVFDPATQINIVGDRDAGQNGFGGWTIGRAATGSKTAVVTKPTMLFDGTNDWLTLGLGAYTGSMLADETILMGVRVHDDSTAGIQALMANRSTAGGGSNILGVALRMGVTPATGWTVFPVGGDGTSFFPTAGAGTTIQAFGIERIVGWRYTHATRTIRSFSCDGVTINQGGALSLAGFTTCASGLPARVGASTSGASPSSIETTVPFSFIPASVTDPQLIAISAQLLAGDHR